jgi:polysaccharide pyruvyl transferase WcaK-like protein
MRAVAPGLMARRPHTSRKKSKFAFPFLAGMTFTTMLYATVRPFLLFPPTEQEESNTSGSTVARSTAILNVLLLEVHLEGNLGDEMETSPLLDFLKKKHAHFQVSTTAALSGWLEGPEKQLSFRSVREHGKIDHILTMEELLSNSTRINEVYDVVILAPGPWKLCRLRKDVWKKQPFRIHVLFAGSIISEPANSEPCRMHAVLKKWNPTLIAVRETRSYRKLQALGLQDTIVTMSGDLSHSFSYAPATFEYWRKIYGDTSRYSANMSVIFPRANNVEQSTSFLDRNVILQTWNNDDTDSAVTLPGHQVIFATSSAIEDWTVFQDWMHKYHNRVQAHQFVVCDTVEQLFGLISHAQHVYTDRYHPGVAAHALGIDFSIMRYEEERDKLIGLRDLVYKDQYSAQAIHDTFNAKAFEFLEGILEGAAFQMNGINGR